MKLNQNFICMLADLLNKNFDFTYMSRYSTNGRRRAIATKEIVLFLLLYLLV